jgi:hypothetical protein
MLANIAVYSAKIVEKAIIIKKIGRISILHTHKLVFYLMATCREKGDVNRCTQGN